MVKLVSEENFAKQCLCRYGLFCPIILLPTLHLLQFPMFLHQTAMVQTTSLWLNSGRCKVSRLIFLTSRKTIHTWQSGDVRGFEGTWTETVWDGRLMGGRYASPGVYYYNVVGEGRDGKNDGLMVFSIFSKMIFYSFCKSFRIFKYRLLLFLSFMLRMNSGAIPNFSIISLITFFSY